MRGRVLISSAVCVLAIGASPPEKYYQSVPHQTADVPTKSEPTFHLTSGEAKKDLTSMYAQGYEAIGYSAFNGKESGKSAIAKQAMRVGATDVIYIEKYTETQNAGAVGSTSYSRWGSLSFVTPMSVRRFDQLAMYFRKAPRHGLGVWPRALSDEEKAAISSNKGLVINAVVNGSPAFMADLLPGDIIMSVNGRAVWDAGSARGAMVATEGKTIPVVIQRKGQTITKQVTIPVGDW